MVWVSRIRSCSYKYAYILSAPVDALPVTCKCAKVDRILLLMELDHRLLSRNPLSIVLYTVVCIDIQCPKTFAGRYSASSPLAISKTRLLQLPRRLT